MTDAARLIFGLVLGCLLLLPVGLLGGCGGGDQPTVVLYVSADEQFAREVIAEFEQATGIGVQFVGDTEAQKTTGLVQRLRAEADRPVADVFWSSEVFHTVLLASEGLLAPYTSEATADWPEMYVGQEQRWYGFAGRGRVIVYPPDRINEDDLPTTWMELTDPKWNGRLVMADPRFGTTGGHLAAMKSYWNSMVSGGYYEAFLEGLAANDIRMLPSGNAGVVRAVAAGEADLGMTDTDDVWAAQALGMNVELFYPDHDVDPSRRGVGTLLIPNTVARVADGPNPEEAQRLIDFLLSERVEMMLANSASGNQPLGPGREHPEPQREIPNPLRVNYGAAAALLHDAINQAMEILSDGSSSTPRGGTKASRHQGIKGSSEEAEMRNPQPSVPWCLGALVPLCAGHAT